MTNFLDAYADNYKWMTAVFYGKLTPNNSAVAQITGVPYRHISKDRAPIEWQGDVGTSANTQIYEVWTKPLNGYTPNVEDIFVDSIGLNWQILDVKSSDLVTSTATPVNVVILAQRCKTN